MIRHFVIGLLALSAMACSRGDSTVLPGGTWNLKRLLDEDASAYKRPITITLDTAQSTISGFAGCNQYFSSYTAKNASLRFTGIGSTKMFCEEAMQIENTFLEALSLVRAYKLEADRLYLLKGDSVLMEFGQQL